MDEQLKQQILQQIGPDVIRTAVTRVMSEIADQNVSAEDLIPVVRALESTLEDPNTYPAVVQSLVQAGVVEPDALPPQFEPTIVVMMIIVFNEVIKALQQKNTALPANFAHGGLTNVARALQAQGRHGDTMLAHINPTEAAMLKRMGGSGTINPRTGLPEFGLFSSITRFVSNTVRSVVGAVTDVVSSLGPVAPIIAAVIAPYAIPALAGSIGISSLAAGALYGAGTSLLTGGNPIQGALMGGLSGGLGDMIGGAANSMLGTSLSPTAQTMLGNTLVGGVAGAATGQGFGKGALTGAAGTALGNMVGNLAGSGGGTPFGQGLSSAGKTIGQMASAGFPLKQAVMGGALSGLTAGFLGSRESPLGKAGEVSSEIQTQLDRVNSLLEDPSVPDTAKEAYRNYAQQLQAGQSAMTGYRDTLSTPAQNVLPSEQAAYQQASNLMTAPGTGAYSNVPGVYQELGIAAPTTAGLGSTNLGVNMATGTAAAALAAPFVLDSLAKLQTPQQVQQALQSAATNNPEYFNKLRLNSWDWNDISNRAAQAGVPLGTYVAQNWNDLTESVRYTSPGGLEPVAKARGGALSKVAYLAQGSGNGRADTIDARLSDGEYVIDAETVAMLGDGSTKAGAAKLDAMRRSVRQHKGKALARGKFSPNAKSPLAYLKGAM